jgi:TonB family protein
MPESWKECEGQLIDGQFLLVQHLGGSDHSVVFLTQRGKGTPEKAAIKFVPADPATADTQLSRWKSAAQLSHPNLIKLYESGRCHLAGIDLLYVVMEHASENLAQFLPQRALSPAETRDMLEPFIETLAYLHGKGFVHGGIRPGNILAIDDQLKLSSDAIRRVGEARIGKTPADAYAPPEAAPGPTSEAGDVWALGVTLIEALTQRVPEASTNASDLQQLSVPESLPQPFLDIAHHSLQSKPQQRWTIADISQKLNPKAAPPPPPAPLVSQSIPAAAKPAAPPAKSAPKDAAPPPVPPTPTPRKSAASVDPLSVPLSTVALDRQVVAAKKSPGGGYYLLVAVVLALTVGVVLAIPRFRSSPSDPGASIAPSQPTVQPSTSPTKSAPDAPPKAQPKMEQKQSAPKSNQAPQRSALEPTPDPKQKQNATQGSKQAAQETADAKRSQQPAQKERAPSPAASPASLKSAIPRSDSLRQAEAAPFVADREASIKSGAVTPGEALNQVLPEISDKSRSTVRGTVRSVIKVHVDAEGSVSAAEVASGPSKFFSTAALDAAKRWDFAPAKIDGHAVPSEWLLHFDFTQSDTKVTALPTKP